MSGWCDQLVFLNVALKKCRAKEFGTAVACESGRKDREKNLGNEFGVNKEMGGGGSKTEPVNC